jgi:hypothetical protein
LRRPRKVGRAIKPHSGRQAVNPVVSVGRASRGGPRHGRESPREAGDVGRRRLLLPPRHCGCASEVPCAGPQESSLAAANCHPLHAWPSVMQRGAIAFTPALSDTKLASVQKLGFGAALHRQPSPPPPTPNLQTASRVVEPCLSSARAAFCLTLSGTLNKFFMHFERYESGLGVADADEGGQSCGRMQSFLGGRVPSRGWTKPGVPRLLGR